MRERWSLLLALSNICNISLMSMEPPLLNTTHTKRSNYHNTSFRHYRGLLNNLNNTLSVHISIPVIPDHCIKMPDLLSAEMVASIFSGITFSITDGTYEVVTVRKRNNQEKGRFAWQRIINDSRWKERYTFSHLIGAVDDLFLRLLFADPTLYRLARVFPFLLKKNSFQERIDLLATIPPSFAYRIAWNILCIHFHIPTKENAEIIEADQYENGSPVSGVRAHVFSKALINNKGKVVNKYISYLHDFLTNTYKKSFLLPTEQGDFKVHMRLHKKVAFSETVQEEKIAVDCTASVRSYFKVHLTNSANQKELAFILPSQWIAGHIKGDLVIPIAMSRTLKGDFVFWQVTDSPIPSIRFFIDPQWAAAFIDDWINKKEQILLSEIAPSHCSMS